MTTVQLDAVTTLKIKVREAESQAIRSSRRVEFLYEKAGSLRERGDENGAMWAETHAEEEKDVLLATLQELRDALWDLMLTTGDTGDTEVRRKWEQTANEMRLLGWGK